MKYSITPFGGQDEIGKNMYLISIDEDLYLIEAGVKYPEKTTMGIDYVIPNIDFLIEHKKRLRGIFISHAHAEVSGALPYIADKLNVPIYAPLMVCNLYEKQIKNKKLLYPIKRNDNKTIKVGKIEVTFVKVAHDLPETYMIVLKTKEGNIVYSSDYVFDANTNAEYDFDFKSLFEIANDKTLALLSNSRQADLNSNTNYVAYVVSEIKNALKHKDGKVILTMHFEDLQMINAAVNQAAAMGKKAVIYGIKSKRLIDSCAKEGLFKYPRGTLIGIEQAKELDPKKLVIINTGDNGEPFHTLANMGDKIDANFAIEDNDYVLITLPVTPQLELAASQAMDSIYKSDAYIRQLEKSRIVQSFPGAEDIKMLYKILRPQYIIPINGEYRQLYKHIQICQEANIDENKIKLLDNGNTFSFSTTEEIQNPITRLFKAREVYIDAKNQDNINNAIINDREVLAENGVLIAQLNISRSTKEPKGKLLITTRGYVDDMRLAQIDNDLNRIVLDYLENNKDLELKKIKESIRSKIVNYLNRKVKQVPLVLTIINEV